MPPRSFSVHVPEAVLDDLQKRLAATRWPEPIPGSGWEYGANTDFIRDLCAYWRDGYDWREHERQLNRFPGFLAEVDGVEIHFWHVKGKGPSPFPLLLIHGWPGSIFEFHSMIDRLTDPASHGGSPADAFDVVVPALPGFGWSGKPREGGWGITRIAHAFDTLMTTELGYRRFGVQGGDWGGIIAAKMASAHAANLAGIHLNFVTGRIPAPESTSDPGERAAIDTRTAFQARETGYSNVQGTKPDSLTLAQSDSPAGLAAWIVEKFRTWSDCGGDVLSAFSKDDLLTNLMFYWAPPSIASAARIYYEATRDAGAFAYPRVEVPTAVAVFPAEPWRVPRSWAEPRFNITRWTELDRGGHFAALEQPALLYEDIRAFFATVR
jgi:pimeloyl-ACP methyl ester carboxylesterase